MSVKDGGAKLVACVCLVFHTWRINYSEALPVLASETLRLVGFLSFLVRGGGGADFWVLGEKLLCLPFPREQLEPGPWDTT